MTANPNYRVCNTDDLTLLARHARQSRFNRTAEPALLDRLDPDGVHLLDLVLYGHNMDRPSPLHHRCRVLCKVTGSVDPVTLTLDIRDEDWRRLHTLDEFQSAPDPA